MQHETENRSRGNLTEKWNLTDQIIVCYRDEYATDITDILHKIISQGVPKYFLINRCTS